MEMGKEKHLWVLGNPFLHMKKVHPGVPEALLLLQTFMPYLQLGNLWVWVRMVPVWAFCKKGIIVRVGSCMGKYFISL